MDVLIGEYLLVIVDGQFPVAEIANSPYLKANISALMASLGCWVVHKPREGIMDHVSFVACVPPRVHSSAHLLPGHGQRQSALKTEGSHPHHSRRREILDARIVMLLTQHSTVGMQPS